MVARRRYTKAEKAKVVALASMTSTLQAAESIGANESTVRYWIDQPEFAHLRDKSRDQVADEFWTAIQVGVKEVARGLTDPDTPLSAKSVALGILYDKHALLTGGATGRTESRDLTGSLADADIIDAILEAESIASPGGSAPSGEDTPEG